MDHLLSGIVFGLFILAQFLAVLAAHSVRQDNASRDYEKVARSGSPSSRTAWVAKYES